ncbi:cyclase family protein [Microbacterium ulmi]|uniref:Cyclase family protein n=1 Tax=Microbacterium ulmi TaxID=179095 RepID=A0A7Y2Q1U5_9MICO|nr:cyclase family protein [Microbacterium ulmi]NII69099.1 kynurenine formamidase [Microbacterium ulmi]NNH04707.1 cyclase family protein [Microbacterium ulmi]
MPESGPKEYTEDDLLELFDRVSNTGRWGDDDELGTLNYITPEKRVAAAKLVALGETLSLARPLSTEQTPANPSPPVHFMVAASRANPSASALDYFGGAPHGRAFTHLDAVAHNNFEGRVYNGRRAEDVYQPKGLTFGSSFAQRHGIFTRGVLLDIARTRGVPYLEPDQGVTVSDLEAAEQAQGVRVESGDVLLLHIGYLEFERATGRYGNIFTGQFAGLTPDTIEWLHEREVAVYGGDCIEQNHPSERFNHLPLHRIAIPSMGLILVDYPDVESLAARCAELARWEFLFTMAPIALPKATGSFINPIAVF